VYSLPTINNLVKTYVTTYPPGHFYNPIISIDEVKLQESQLFNNEVNDVAGIDLNKENQLLHFDKLLPNMKSFVNRLKQEAENFRYYKNNGYFSLSDAALLASMIQMAKPRKIIEVGSGFSSALMMDVNELYFSNSISLTFIELYTERLKNLIGHSNPSSTIIEKGVQFCDLTLFDELKENDILFIDSSHVSKTGSDVNFLLFNVIPRLNKGVFIHFHDIFFPFEYPKSWVTDWFKGFGWNEIYVLRAFLMNNHEYSIEYFNSYMNIVKADQYIELFNDDSGSCSIWIKKD
jgi:predicted O-methyltransferase YrrM